MAILARVIIGIAGPRVHRNKVHSPNKLVSDTRSYAIEKQSNQDFHGEGCRQIQHLGLSPSELDDASGIWQPSDGPMSWLDPGSNGMLELGAQDDYAGPALDYIMRYPPPTEDDPNSPTLSSTDTAAALAGPDMHAVLEVEVEAEVGMAADGAARRIFGAPSLVEQLRQRALSGSSDDDGEDKERWRSMDIPALLLSPHHASALHSLSSTEDDTSAVPDFADLTLAREAERAAQEAAADVPPELQPLVRAANLLGVHTQKGRGRVPGDWGTSPASEPEARLRLRANRFEGITEPLTAEQLENAVAVINNITSAAGLARRVTAGRAPAPFVVVAACAAGGSPGAEDAVAAGSCSRPSHGDADASDTGEDEQFRAALAAVAEEEGVEWLSPGRPAPGASVTAAAAVSATAVAAAAATATVAAEEALVIAAAPGWGRGWGAQREVKPAALAVEEEQEVRSVQLRRAPRSAGAERQMDPAVRSRIAEEVAREVRDADAHVVRTGTAGSRAATGQLVPPTSSSTTAAALPTVDGRVAEGAEAAAAEAAASLAAEIRTAVWGEGGLPYGSALRSSDIVEELKHSIHELQDEAEHGAPNTLLP